MQLYAKIGIRVSLVGIEIWDQRDLIQIHTLCWMIFLHIYGQEQRDLIVPC